MRGQPGFGDGLGADPVARFLLYADRRDDSGPERTSAKRHPCQSGRWTVTRTGLFTRHHENDEGVGDYRDGDWDLAAHHFRRALMSDPSMAEAHFNLAFAFVQLRKHRDATKEFESAIELAPCNPQIAEATVLRQYLGRSEGNRYDGLP
jgi:tetratricopeptide (TPR) repeat protein